MGICIQKNLQDLETICAKQPQFQVDKSKHNLKSMAVWQVTQNSCDSLKWPFIFHSTSSYILIIVGGSNIQNPILQQDRTSIQLAQMLFGAQFLCLHIKIDKKIMLNNKQYDMKIYSFHGDSVEDQLMVKARLAYYLQQLQKYLQFGAGSFCLYLLNQGQPVTLKNQLKQFIDFDSEQYSEAQAHIFFKEQLFGNKISMLQKLNQSVRILCQTNFITGFEKLLHVDIKQQKIKKQDKIDKKKPSLDESLPFACEITQIDIRGGGGVGNKVPKLQAGNIDESNVLFEQLGMNGQTQEMNKMQEFLKGLYLGTEKVSKDYSTLNEKKVKIIVNCAASYCKNWFVNDINYIWIDMSDPTQSHTKPFNIECLIYFVADLIGKCLAQQSGVLIHCSGYNQKIDYSGSRSAAILIGVLMSSLKLGYDDAFSTVNKKWKIKIPLFMQKQLRDMQKRKKQKTKGFYVYSICSYSANFPKHIVAKYICEIQNVQNIQGIQNFSKSVFLCVGSGACKIMFGRQCEYKQEYEKYAKQHLRLLAKYEGYNSQVIVEPIQKTFRKQAKIEITQQILHIQIKGRQKNAGFVRNEQIILKYPILRPVWEKKKQDGFYFTIKQKQQGAQVMMNKGMKWIGYEEDKQNFFDKIITCYLGHIPHDKIFIMESQQDQSLFDTSQINI